MNDATDDLHSNEVDCEYWIYLRLAFLRAAKGLRGKAQAIVERFAATTDDVPELVHVGGLLRLRSEGCRRPQTEKATGAHQTCSRHEGFEGAEQSASPIMRIILVSWQSELKAVLAVPLIIGR